MSRLYIVLFLIPIAVLSQTIEEKLKGTWVCVNVTDSIGNKSSGEFGSSRNYLKFQFDGSSLFISLSPFDKGAKHRISYRQDYFDLVNTLLNQKQYKIVSQFNDTLLLKTEIRKNKKIFYHLINSSIFTKDIDQVSNLREYEKMILELTFVKSAFGSYLNSYYLIDNSILNLLPSPVFVDKQFFSLGEYIEANLNIPLGTMKELNGKETVFEFDVTNRGIENISIIEKLGEDIDFQIYDMIRGMNKKWEPVIVDGKMIVIRLRLHLSFTYKEN